MADGYAVVAEGLADINSWSAETTREVDLSAVQALNKTADHIRTAAAREIVRQVNFPASYVSPREGRLTVTAKATRGNLEAKVTARGRVTSLARFVIGSAARGEAVQLAITPGKTVTLKRAFLVRLRAGTSELDTKSNLGLAVRLKPGQSLRNKYAAQRTASGLYLLYGPSVAQLFINNAGGGVAEQLTPEAIEYMEAEFARLMAR